MAESLAVVVRRLYDEGRLDAILGMGGGGGTSIATTGMRALPFGVPKVMVSTVADGNVRAFVGPKDIIMMPSIVDVAGINRISARVYANAVGAIETALGGGGRLTPSVDVGGRYDGGDAETRLRPGPGRRPELRARGAGACRWG